MLSAKPIYYDTLEPYAVVKHLGIEYCNCHDYEHISRYKGLRQISHLMDNNKRFTALETANPLISKAKFRYYEVTSTEENRLDLIAFKFYGSPNYSWVISYFNNIEDGFTVHEGQKIKILENFTDLFNKGELLATIPALQLNLGTE